MSLQSFDPASVLRVDVQRITNALRHDREHGLNLLTDAQARCTARAATVPAVRFPPELPISAHVDEIQAQLRSHPVVIVAGETGSGKTTQLPKLCLATGFGVRGQIVHTQPRRLAARAVAARIAEELGVPLGNQVGYAVRFSDRTSPQTLVKVMTDGLLLTEIRKDKDLAAYDVVIVDEAHERSLNIDFLLGYLKRLLQRRHDLKVVITSATIDVAQFSRHFGNAPVVTVGGRGFPVEVVYQDPVEADDAVAAIDRALDLIEARPPGAASDVLVFLPGEREILETSRALRGARGSRWDVLPLYARLTAAEQQRIFTLGAKPRIVLTTNVAETSLTVPNIGYVVDTGYARLSRYSFRSKLQRLPVERVSQASADQRKGRCGRIAPGLCIRLYSEADHLAQPAYTDPEILRTNLAAVVLQMRAFNLGDAAKFPFLDPPDPRALNDALTLLHELGALVADRLTPSGRAMARLPVDPRLARMLVAAARAGALTELLIIVSGLAIVDPRERPLAQQAAADAAHREFRDDRSDFLTLMRLWHWHEEARQSLGSSALKRACRDRFLSASRLREWRDLHRQLLLACRAQGWRLNSENAGHEAIHRCIVAGSLSLVGFKRERGEYSGSRNLTFRIFPGSGLAQRQPRWLVAAEITETARIYARCVAEVEPSWIEAAGAHLLKRTYAEPYWDVKRGEVVAFERATLYGLPVVDRRRISFKRVDRALAREIFIRHGLVPGALARPPACIAHNLALVRDVHELEAKTRRRDLLVAEEVLAGFYEARLPADVTDLRSFESWRRSAEARDARLLFMARSDVLIQSQIDDPEQSFPPSLVMDGVQYRLKYSFAPGAVDDGVSLQVGLGMLLDLRRERLEWLVPGLLSVKCEQLLRSLPKLKRRALAPIGDKVDTIVRHLLRPDCYAQGRLDLAIGRVIERQFNVHTATDDWHPERLAEHLLMNIQVRDDSGRLIDQGRDLDLLRQRLDQRIEARLDDASRAALQEQGLEHFPDQGVPQRRVITEGGTQLAVYPALRDHGDRVDLVMARTPAEQAQLSERGYTRLVQLSDRQSSRYMRRIIKEERILGLHYASLGNAEQLCDEVLHAATWHCFFANGGLPFDRAAFQRRLDERHGQWLPTFQLVLDGAKHALAARFEVARRLDAETSPAYAAAVTDLREHLAALIPADFLSRTPVSRLVDLPRYLEGMLVRLDGLQGRVAKDAECAAVLRAFGARLARLAASVDGRTDIEEIRFALEELRIALFAQRLGTRGKISAKRVAEQLRRAEVEAGLK